MSVSYIKDGSLQPAALMSRELAANCSISCPPLGLPAASVGGNKNGDDKSGSQFPFDYYTARLEIQYPDNSKEGTFYLPGVIVYNLQRSIGSTIRYPLGYSKGFVAYFAPAILKAYDGFSFSDKRFASTPQYTWIECKIYPNDTTRLQLGGSSKNLDVEVARTVNGKTKRFSYDSLADFFGRVNAVAVKVNMTCTIKLQAQVTKGKPLPSKAMATPVMTPSKISILGPVDVAEPVLMGNKKSVTTEQDNADDSFFNMIESMNMNDDGDAEEQSNDLNDDDDNLSDPE